IYESDEAPFAVAALLEKRRGLLAHRGRSALLDLVGDRLAHRSLEPRRIHRNELLESRNLRCAGTARRRLRPALVDCLCAASGGERLLCRRTSVCAYDDAVALARVAEQSPARPLAGERPLLPAEPGGRRSREPGVSHR